MELLAFTHAASVYEDPGPEPQIRPLGDLDIQIPSSAWMGLASLMVIGSVMNIAPHAEAVVGPGDICPEVSDVQRALLNAGFNPGGVDGIFGSNTATAVRNFQSSSGLAVDGIVGPATANALGLETVDSAFLVGNVCEEGAGTGGGGPSTVIAASGVNIREAPGFTRIIGFAGFGETVSITDERTTAEGLLWARLADQSGWVAAEFLDIGDPGGGTGGGGLTITAPSGVYVRSTPNGAIIGGKDFGETVALTGQSSTAGGLEWVKLAGEPGWIAADFLSGGTGGGTGGGGTGGGGFFTGPTGTRTVRTFSGFGVNVRNAPNGDFVSNLADGTSVTLSGRYSFGGGYQWAEISDGTWVATDFLL